MLQDPIRELLELAIVNHFYLDLLQRATGHAVPLPSQPSGSRSPFDRIGHAVKVLKDWLDILDMAIPPLMIRDALRNAPSTETAEAVLRYLYLKRSKNDADRDKADFAVSHLYRKPSPWRNRPEPPPLEADGPELYAQHQARALEFEAQLYTMLGEVPPPALPEEHHQLLREFEFIYQQVEEFRHFDHLMDSGLVQKVRGIKQALGTSFYHPRVLANVAVYNTFFGTKFDRLFAAAASEIKQFAARVQQEGASVLSRVEGEVTVQHLQEVQEERILKADYAGAQESFRRVSQFKKAVSKRANHNGAAGRREAVPAGPGAAAPAPLRTSTPGAASAHIRVLEDGKTRVMLETIRAFVRAADPASAGVVPLRGGNVALTPAEVDAFRADYGEEKSFRVDFANCLTELVALHSRMASEMTEYRAKQDSEYLWKPHADALTVLITAAGEAQGAAHQVMKLAEQRGLADKAKALGASMEKLSAQVQRVARMLQG